MALTDYTTIYFYSLAIIVKLFHQFPSRALRLVGRKLRKQKENRIEQDRKEKRMAIENSG